MCFFCIGEYDGKHFCFFCPKKKLAVENCVPAGGGFENQYLHAPPYIEIALNVDPSLSLANIQFKYCTFFLIWFAASDSVRVSMSVCLNECVMYTLSVHLCL